MLSRGMHFLIAECILLNMFRTNSHDNLSSILKGLRRNNTFWAFEVLAAVNIKIIFFWNVMSCSVWYRYMSTMQHIITFQKSTVLSSMKSAFLHVMLTECGCRLVTFFYFQESTAEFSAAGERTENDQDGSLTDEVYTKTTVKNFTVFP